MKRLIFILLLLPFLGIAQSKVSAAFVDFVVPPIKAIDSAYNDGKIFVNSNNGKVRYHWGDSTSTIFPNSGAGNTLTTDTSAVDGDLVPNYVTYATGAHSIASGEIYRLNANAYGLGTITPSNLFHVSRADASNSTYYPLRIGHKKISGAVSAMGTGIQFENTTAIGTETVTGSLINRVNSSSGGSPNYYEWKVFTFGNGTLNDALTIESTSSTSTNIYGPNKSSTPRLTLGSSTLALAGPMTVTTDFTAGFGNPHVFKVTASTGEMLVNNSAGTSGYVLTSAGAGAAATWAAASGGSVTSIATTSPITGGTITTTGTIGINNAVADGSTKGAASFTATDFNASSGNISLDYTNGQAASGSVNGFLSSTDWTTFNNKVSTSRSISTTSPITGGGDLSADRTFACATCVTSAASLTANALMIGGGSQTSATTTTGTGILTWLGTPSWTNFNSAITGTAPYWSLANGGTFTGTNTLTMSTNPLIFSSGVTTGTGATSGIQFAANSLTAGDGFSISSSSLQSGNALKLISTSTAANDFALLNIASSGTNANSSRTAKGGVISVTNTGTTSTNTALTLTASGATNNYALITTGDVGLGTSAPTGQLHINGRTLGGALSTDNWLNIVGTFPASLSSTNTGIFFQITGAGTPTQATQAFRVSYLAGNTGSGLTNAGFLSNASAATNTTAPTMNATSGNAAMYLRTTATTTGHNYGLISQAFGGDLSVGIIGQAQTAKASAINYGVVGLALNTSNHHVAGYFATVADATAIPTTLDGVIIADNGSQSINILDLKANGTSVVTVGSAGLMTVGTTNAIKGTATNNNATAGNIGEFSSSLVMVGSAVSLTSTTTANVTSLSLTAGDWDVAGAINFTEGSATVTTRTGAITSTSATLPTDGSEVENGVLTTVVSTKLSIVVPRKRFSLSGTTTVYLVANSTFSAGTSGVYGQLTARRVR